MKISHDNWTSVAKIRAAIQLLLSFLSASNIPKERITKVKAYLKAFPR
jgi:hypothetical protein